jgi:hypothetical protein
MARVVDPVVTVSRILAITNSEDLESGHAG